MNIEQLVRMANQISQFFDGDASEAEAVADIRNHLQRFWAPSMREALCAALAEGRAEGLSHSARQAVAGLDQGG
ncbi:formate dehydrogenase subunit delta [uncultured Aquitalea sp.]|uniref:formate dehydrogenase subunit delta n=1 Tax=uncultured Aquitalea sp. TaxID=540272 RepID=UPI0025F11C0B|nr:formate dehydrogenase subunit delta [uncultured Aquitalea sp.]